MVHTSFDRDPLRSAEVRTDSKQRERKPTALRDRHYVRRTQHCAVHFWERAISFSFGHSRSGRVFLRSTGEFLPEASSVPDPSIGDFEFIRILISQKNFLHIN